MMHRFENPRRLAELAPASTLERIGLGERDVFCDVGAGTGVFTFAAAERTRAGVYAVEIDADLLDLLHERAVGVPNVHVLPDMAGVPAHACDVALLCTVLHETEDRAGLAAQTARVLKPGGEAAVIEFFARQTQMGPPPAHRVSEQQAAELFDKAGFSHKETFALSENYYCARFVKRA